MPRKSQPLGVQVLRLEDEGPNGTLEHTEGNPDGPAECLICDSQAEAATFERLPLCELCHQACKATLEGSYRYLEELNGPMSEDIRTEFRRQFAKQLMDMVLHGLECPCPGCKHRRSLVWTKPDAAEGIRKYSEEAGSHGPQDR